MKKIKCFCFVFVCFASFLHSQSITQAFNEPVAGDSSKTYDLDTTAFVSGLPMSINGNTAIWDFTALKQFPSNSFVTYYVSPATVTNSSSFPGTTFVEEQSGLNNFYKSVTTPSPQSELLGLNSNTMSLTFTNSAIIAKYPMNYGTTFTDNIGGNFTFSVNGTFAGLVKTNVDGLGTLKLPGNVTLSNVLRVKSIQTITLTVLAVIQLGTVQQTVYEFYHSSNKFPILSVNYQAIAITGSATTTGAVSGNYKVFFTGINDQNFDATFSIFPNPTKNNFNVNLSNPNSESCTMEIFSVTGEVKKKINLGEKSVIKSQVDISDLSSGIYFVKTQLGEKISVRKLVVE